MHTLMKYSYGRAGGEVFVRRRVLPKLPRATRTSYHCVYCHIEDVSLDALLFWRYTSPLGCLLRCAASNILSSRIASELQIHSPERRNSEGKRGKPPPPPVGAPACIAMPATVGGLLWAHDVPTVK